MTGAGTNQERNLDERYDHLVDRAITFIESSEGAVAEDRLIGHVFGAASPPDLWRPLLRTILESEPRLRQPTDRTWSLAGHNQAHLPVADWDYVVVDVETTGLRSRHHRITEVAIISVSKGNEAFAWSSLVNPDRSIPQYVQNLTGIDNLMVASAPSFRSIAPTVLELIGDKIIVGHNTPFDVGFLNAELKRAGHPRLISPLIDTLMLADFFVPESRRLSLSAVAAALDVSHTGAHRAMADAETTMAVLQRIRGRAQAQDFDTVEQLIQLSAKKRSTRRSANSMNRGRSILDRSHLENIPNLPGVYIMRDSEDRVIYVGKAKDLRKRVSSYYSQPLGYTRKMDGLLETLRKIDIEVVGSELEALVLESQLIRRYNPRFNTVQRNVEQYVFVKVDISNQWPTVTLTKERQDDGARYFGPFRSNRQTRDAVRLINDILPLRTCRRNFKTARSYGSPCIELSLKRCAGPCLGLADRDEYRGHVNDVLAFFDGDSDRILKLLHSRLESTVASLDYERAAKIRDQIARLERISLEQATLSDAAGAGHALLVLPAAAPDEKAIWYLVNGQRWAQLLLNSDESPAQLADRLMAVRCRASSRSASVLPDHHSVDEIATIWRAFQRSPEHPAYRNWNDDEPAVDMAAWVLAVDLETTFG